MSVSSIAQPKPATMIEQFEKISARTASVVTLLLLSTICPGVLIIYFFQTPLFISQETFKIILLGASMTLPVWFINVLVTMLLMPVDKSDEYYTTTISLVSSVLTMVVMYCSILIRYLFFDELFWIIAVMQVLIIIIFIIDHRMDSKNKKLSTPG